MRPREVVICPIKKFKDLNWEEVEEGICCYYEYYLIVSKIVSLFSPNIVTKPSCKKKERGRVPLKRFCYNLLLI